MGPLKQLYPYRMRATDPVGTGYPDSLILDLDFSGFAGLALIRMGKERKKKGEPVCAVCIRSRVSLRSLYSLYSINSYMSNRVRTVTILMPYR